jgi:hypothetical protein
MNVREGMRRLGILVAACGGILGGCLAYSDARTTWDDHTAHRKFGSLMASPIMQKVAKAARDYLKPSRFGGIRVVESQVLTYADGTIREDAPENNTHGPWEKYKLPPGAKLVSPSPPDFDQWKAEQQRLDELKAAGAFLVSVDLDGIKQVTVDKAGVVSSIELSTGESVQRVGPPALKAYVVPLLYPILGFLLPWGGIRVLTWVGGGFVEPRR